MPESNVTQRKEKHIIFQNIPMNNSETIAEALSVTKIAQQQFMNIR
jgi:hypothetical protein